MLGCFQDNPLNLQGKASQEAAKLTGKRQALRGFSPLIACRTPSCYTVAMVAEKNLEIRKAVNTLYDLSADEKVRAEYEQRVKAWRDRQSALDGDLILHILIKRTNLLNYSMVILFRVCL